MQGGCDALAALCNLNVTSAAQLQLHRRALLEAAAANFRHKQWKLRLAAVRAVEELGARVRPIQIQIQIQIRSGG